MAARMSHTPDRGHDAGDERSRRWKLPGDPADLPVRVIDGTYHRHSRPRQSSLELPLSVPAGRYNGQGPTTCVYASSTRRGAWDELARHTIDGIFPYEVRRRMARLEVSGLPILDLTDPVVRERIGVSLADLIGPDYQVCQDIADVVRGQSKRFGGILAPSAVQGQRLETLVIFRDRLEAHVTVKRESDQSPPAHRPSLYRRIRRYLFPWRYL